MQKEGKVMEQKVKYVQPDLFGGRTPGEKKREKHVGFKNPDPDEIMIGTKTLGEYLRAIGLLWIIEMRRVMQEMDWSEFESRYDLTGRSPYAPVIIMSLILYGTMMGRSSLRQLEGLAKIDLGAMYLTGGEAPDYSQISRFIQRHKDLITEAFFMDLTKKILKETHAKPKIVAGDGTIVEAAASKFQKIKLEVAQEEAKEAKDKAEANPEDEEIQKRNEQAQKVVKAAEVRAKERHSYGGKREQTLVARTEPEAAVLKTKDGLVRPAYVPSVVVDSERFILGAYVHQTSEIAAIEPMLYQAKAVSDAEVESLLLDKGYGVGPVVQDGLKQGVKVLAPLKSPPRHKDGRFSKEDFKYDKTRDVYVCPWGKILSRRGKGQDRRRGAKYIIYSAQRQDCAVCPLRSQCTKAKDFRPRRIYRYSTDQYLEALRGYMKNDEEKALISKRKSMVEPVFSHLKGIQGLKRFKRFGLENVRVEFAIHACAYNLRRYTRYLGAADVYGQGPGPITPSNRKTFCFIALYNLFYASNKFSEHFYPLVG